MQYTKRNSDVKSALNLQLVPVHECAICDLVILCICLSIKNRQNNRKISKFVCVTENSNKKHLFFFILAKAIAIK